RIKIGGKEYYVMAQLTRQSRLTPQDLDKVFVRNNKGQLIQLSSLVTHEQGAAPNSINHYGRLRSASITASPGTVPIGTVVTEVEAMLAKELPAGFLYAWGGDAKSLNETSNEVWWVLVLAMIIIYMTLAAQFESLVHPLTVMIALPLAAIGAFGLLWLLDFGGKAGLYPPIPAMNINLFSLVGLVLLIGLVTKNSILLVEYANQQVAKGAGSHEAMVQAGLVRLRPILMTAFSTIAGILPIAVGFGAGAESRRPMGVAVVGGMLTSTFLTLFVVPVVYTFFSDVTDRVFKRRLGSAASGALDAKAGVPASPD
ncbi:MAG TPA: efflux RND transporter permease subunit, partial [Verrucomicrobiae bacterium]|nr:efflux RND transporter permease subunit [Verrucomicrobiae bacterium]